MFRSDGLCTVVDESLVVEASKDDEEVKVEAWGHIIKEKSMAEGLAAESHPIRKQIGFLVRLCCRHNATSGCFCCSKQFRAKSIMGGRWHMCQGLS